MTWDSPRPPVPPRPLSSSSTHHYPPSSAQHCVFSYAPALEKSPPVPPLPQGYIPQPADLRRPSSPGMYPPVRPLGPQTSHSFRGLPRTTSDVYGMPSRAPSAPPSHVYHPQPGFPPNNVMFAGPSRASTLNVPPARPHPNMPLPSPPVPAARAPSMNTSAFDMTHITEGMANFRIQQTQTPPPMHQYLQHRESYVPHMPPPPPSASTINLVAPLPTIAILENALPSIQSPYTKEANRVAWIRDVLLIVKLANAASEGLPQEDPNIPMSPTGLSPRRVVGNNTALERLAQSALDMLVYLMPASPSKEETLSPALAEALYIRATLTAAGTFPEYITKSLKTAFREFETAGRAGFLPAWFKLGRDYETFGNAKLASQCFERGASGNDASCLFRLGMARLLGQLELEIDLSEATRLLHQAATIATIECPHPAYVYALLLRDEAVQASLPNNVVAPFIPQGSSRLLESRKHLERAAYLHHTPALTRIGRAYEFADEPFAFDPVLSVDYYNLASDEGDAQADVALSKWFLCGAERFFGKDEARARECALRGASRGSASAKFAMGYYLEVGIGAPKDPGEARRWYTEAAAAGNAEAEARLNALYASDANSLSRAQHENLAEDTLVRTRTLARIRSQRGRQQASASPRPMSNPRQEPMQSIPNRQQSLPTETYALDPYDGDTQMGQRPLPAYTTAMRSHSNDTFSIPLHLNPEQMVPPQPPYTFQQRPHSPSQADPQDQQFANRQRFTLTDPGVSPTIGTTGLPPTSDSPRMGHRRLLSNNHPARTTSLGPGGDANGVVTGQEPRAATKYATFADMGIEGKKLEQKECVIM